MNQKQLAKELGISAAMVTKLAKRGMPVDSVERALRWRKRHLEVSRIKGNRMDSNFSEAPAPAVASAQPPLADTHGEGDAPKSADQAQETSNDYANSRARREKADAERSELALARELGKVVSSDSVKRSVFDAFRTLRDEVMGVSRKVAPQLATMHDLREIELAIDAAYREALTNFADVTGPRLLEDRLKVKGTETWFHAPNDQGEGEGERSANGR